MRPFAAVITASVGLALLGAAGDEPDPIAQRTPRLMELYRHLHANPELSFHEEATAARMARELGEAGFEVTTGVGGHGVVGVLRNGEGPVVLYRTDMDALPVTERTGLAYASRVRVLDDGGAEVGVMHACGHDAHMTIWVGVAQIMHARRHRWRGTLLMVAQPAEERIAGAAAMLRDGLYDRFPKPRHAVAVHVDPALPHGVVGYRPGPIMANIDTVDIEVRGRGGHGAAPHLAIDPIVIASRLVLDLQTLISREIDPLESAVVTVGSIHGGTKHNVIPSTVKLQLTVRSFSPQVREALLAGIARKAKAAADAAGAPEPTVSVVEAESSPAVINDDRLTERIVAALRAAIGAASVRLQSPRMVGEDFSRFAAGGVAICMLRLGSSAPEALAEADRTGVPVPGLHTDGYAPVAQPTIETGIKAMVAVLADLLQPAP